MRNLDKSPLLHLMLCLFVASATSLGCGDGTTAETKPDGGRDSALAADAATADARLLDDMAKTDAPSVADTAAVDTPLPEDTAKADTHGSLDGGPDASRVDAGWAQDADSVDVPAKLDSSVVEVGNAVDGTPSVDALATTMATVTFQLTNQGTQAVYLRNACWIHFDVTATADGTVYANQSFCACDCASANCTGAILCGPCAPTSGTAVQAGETTNLWWTAQSATLQTKTGTTGSFQCVSLAPIPTGSYRVAIVVYPTAEDAVAETNGKTIEQGFVLGTANATVAVPIR